MNGLHIRDFLSILAHHRQHQHSFTEHIHLVYGVGLFILGEHVHQRAQHRGSRGVGLPESSVDIRQVGITLQHGRAEQGEGLLREGPRLATFSINVGVGTEEWHPRAELVPTDSKLLRGVLEESGDIRAGEGNTCHSEREQHRNGGLHVFPVGEDVACPDGAVTLGTSEEGARENKRTVGGFTTELAFSTGCVVVISVTR